MRITAETKQKIPESSRTKKKEKKRKKKQKNKRLQSNINNRHFPTNIICFKKTQIEVF